MCHFVCMSNKRVKQQKIQESDITGLAYFNKLAPLLKRLHEQGCARDRAGNRVLHYDQYCLLLLLYLFNPIVTSLRGIQQASELKKVQRKLGCSRGAGITLRSHQRLQGRTAEGNHLRTGSTTSAAGARLATVGHPTYDHTGRWVRDRGVTQDHGSLVRKANTGSGMVKWRLHTHYEVLRGVPTRIDVTRNGGGDDDERAVLETVIESDRLYVMDRGYAKFTLFNKIVAAQSSYVCRLRDNSTWETIEERYRNNDAQLGEIISDEIVRFSPSSRAVARTT